MGLYLEGTLEFEDERLVVYRLSARSDVGELTVAVDKAEGARLFTSPATERTRAVEYFVAKARREVDAAGSWPAQVIFAG